MKSVDAAPVYDGSSIIPAHGEVLAPTTWGAVLANNTKAVLNSMQAISDNDYKVIFNIAFTSTGSTDYPPYTSTAAAYELKTSVQTKVELPLTYFNASVLLNGSADPNGQSIKFEFVGTTTLSVELSNAQGTGTNYQTAYLDLNVLNGQTVLFNIYLRRDSGAGQVRLNYMTLLLCGKAVFL